MPTFNVDLLAAGGTRHPSAADWDASSGILAFGAGRNVAVWRPTDTENFGIHALLSGHSDTVNVVKTLVLPSSGASIILSGAADCTIRLWCPDTSTPTGYQEACILKEHEKSINTIAVLPELNLFASSSAESEVKIWRIESKDDKQDLKVTLTQTINLKPRYFPLTLALARLPVSNEPILAVAGSKTIIQLYASLKGTFEHAATLTGHEGWIRSLDFIQETQDNTGDLLLSSASQDKYIRLWRLRQGEALPTTSDALNDPSLGSIGRSLSNKAHRFSTNGSQYSITFEALLLGHEDWIFTTRWHRNPATNTIRLLSASADNSLAIWEPEASSGVWLCTVRLGEISAQKGATTATGSTGGFWVGLWGPGGNSVASLGRTGSWRLWEHDEATDLWEQKVAVGGHTREVRGLSWSQDGSYLLSTSADQTTRLWAEWRRSNGKKSWHELSRPQIHGYDLNCIDTHGDSQFISGADEKLLRVFDEPKGVADSLEHLCGIKTKSTKPLPELASIPVLGLSNKAMTANEAEDPDDAEQPTLPTTSSNDGETPMPSITHSTPPTEDTLSRHLLWPETEKLYGHGYEISTLASNPSLPLIATACRASSIDHAVIRLYSTDDWLEIKPALTAHSLTVTSLKFDATGKWLLSTGRDRMAVIWRQQEGEGDKGEWKIWAKNEKAHSRMLLGGDWAPPHPYDQQPAFATAGRDKAIHIWRVVLEARTFEKAATITAALPVVTLAFLQELLEGCFILAYALEDGSVWFARVADTELVVVGEPFQIPRDLAPAMAVTELAWRLKGDRKQKERKWQIAIASEDASLRVLDVDLTHL